MRRRISCAVAVCAVAIAASVACAHPAGDSATTVTVAPKSPRVKEVAVLETAQGTIVIKFHPADAP